MGAGESKNAIGQRWCGSVRAVVVVVDVVGVPSCPAVFVLLLVTVDVAVAVGMVVVAREVGVVVVVAVVYTYRTEHMCGGPFNGAFLVLRSRKKEGNKKENWGFATCSTIPYYVVELATMCLVSEQTTALKHDKKLSESRPPASSMPYFV